MSSVTPVSLQRAAVGENAVEKGNSEWASEGDRKSSKLPSMEDGARTLREKRAAYVGMQEWASQDVKRGGTAGF